jgi:hypothetical protein
VRPIEAELELWQVVVIQGDMLVANLRPVENHSVGMAIFGFIASSPEMTLYKFLKAQGEKPQHIKYSFGNLVLCFTSQPTSQNAWNTHVSNAKAKHDA